MRLEKNLHSICNIDDWYRWAPPQKGEAHWVDGRSAKECAKAWCPEGKAPQIPDAINDLLNSHRDFAGWELECVTPEHRVSFDRLGGPRHTDIAAWGRDNQGALCLHIEAKADESFDALVGQVLEAARRKLARHKNTNVPQRVQGLVASLFPAAFGNSASVDGLRYQLLTAVAAVLADARKNEASRAVFIVHEFKSAQTNPAKHARNQRDLDNFVACISSGKVLTLSPGTLEGPFHVPGSPLFGPPTALYVGKAQTSRNAPR